MKSRGSKISSNIVFEKLKCFIYNKQKFYNGMELEMMTCFRQNNPEKMIFEIWTNKKWIKNGGMDQKWRNGSKKFKRIDTPVSCSISNQTLRTWL